MTKKKIATEETTEILNVFPIYVGIIENDKTDKIVSVDTSYKSCAEITTQNFNDTKDNSIRIEKWEDGKLTKTYSADIHFMDDDYDNMFIKNDAIFIFPEDV